MMMMVLMMKDEDYDYCFREKDRANFKPIAAKIMMMMMVLMMVLMMKRRRIKIIAQEKGPCQLSSSCYNGAKKLLQVRSHTAELF